jgi:hypothetical protein
LKPVGFGGTLFVVSWFRQSEVEGQPEATPEQRLAAVERECAAAEQQFNETLAAERAHQVERRRCEAAVRASYERRNKAWNLRAELMRTLGKIR